MRGKVINTQKSLNIYSVIGRYKPKRYLSLYKQGALNTLIIGMQSTADSNHRAIQTNPISFIESAIAIIYRRIAQAIILCANKMHKKT